MSLKITTRDVEGIQIVDFEGQLTMGQEDLVFRAELDRLVKAGKIQVALNFSNLRHLDTTGLGTLLEAQAMLQETGGKLAIFELKTPHIALLAAARCGWLSCRCDLAPDQGRAVSR